MVKPTSSGQPKYTAQSRRYVLYTAVLPAYRSACMQMVSESLGPDYVAFTGETHLDQTVRTGIPGHLFTPVRNRGLLAGRILLQTGRWLEVTRAGTAILDLNPRSLSAWAMLLIRRCLRRRTLLWGHLHPQRGGASPTAILRRTMRKISSGTVLYGYSSLPTAQSEVPGKPVWVAPNSLYPQSEISVDRSDNRKSILYVGRLERAKKLPLLIEGFALSGLYRDGYKLVIVGHGSQLEDLRTKARELGVETHCYFAGRIYDTASIKLLYKEAMCSVSPGYAGLSLTQSIGFGVPVLVADDEPHSPEIELASSGAVQFFSSDSPTSLATLLRRTADAQPSALPERWSRLVAESYSAEAMAAGLVAAFKNEPQLLLQNDWTIREE